MSVVPVPCRHSRLHADTFAPSSTTKIEGVKEEEVGSEDLGIILPEFQGGNKSTSTAGSVKVSGSAQHNAASAEEIAALRGEVEVLKEKLANAELRSKVFGEKLANAELRSKAFGEKTAEDVGELERQLTLFKIETRKMFNIIKELRRNVSGLEDEGEEGGSEKDNRKDNRKDNKQKDKDNDKDNNSSATKMNRASTRANAGKRELQWQRAATGTGGAADKKPKVVKTQGSNAKKGRSCRGNLGENRKRSAGEDKKGGMPAYSGVKLIEGKGGSNLKEIRAFLKDFRENCSYSHKMSWGGQTYNLYNWVEQHLQKRYNFKVCKPGGEKTVFPSVEDLQSFGNVTFLLLPPEDWPQFEPHRRVVERRRATLGKDKELTKNPCNGKNFIVSGQSLFNYIHWLGNLLNARGVGEEAYRKGPIVGSEVIVEWANDEEEFDCIVVEGKGKGTLAVKVATTKEKRERNSYEEVIPFDPVEDTWRFKVLEGKEVKGGNRKRQKRL
ncbi:hypothetical protein TrCOL_g1215 [Triparma columacea]|uniref:Uncharacterized protein n=1 Tax=Triparma columacea TaxID=722753 RepID=A0A9W7GMX3_9STRA|nr:hypothetical protein TrCOL_g1215 [Triparma columacea]